MYIFVEPMDEEGIARIQENKRTDMSKFLKELGDKKEAYLRSLKEPDEDIEATLEGQNEPTDLEVAEDKDGTAAQAEEEESEEEGTESDEDESIDSEEEGLDEAWLEKVGQESAAGPGELLAFTLKIKNMVNGKYVLRPDHFKPSDKWEVEYDLEEIRDARAWTTYRACQKRRELNLSSNRRVDGLKDQDDIKDIYIKNLREMSVKGREYLAQQEKEAPVEKIVWTGTYKAKTD